MIRTSKSLIPLWVIPIMMLILTSLFHFPYGYYRLLKIIITACGSYLAYLEFIRTQSLSLFVIAFALIAILFNPVIPIYFSKSIWIGIDILSALIFIVHGYIFHNTKDKF